MKKKSSSTLYVITITMHHDDLMFFFNCQITCIPTLIPKVDSQYRMSRYIIQCELLSSPYRSFFVIVFCKQLILEATTRTCIQWNPFNPDTPWATSNVLINGVSLFQGFVQYHQYLTSHVADGWCDFHK